MSVTESNDTQVVDLGLDKGTVVEVTVKGKAVRNDMFRIVSELVYLRLCADFDGNTTVGGFGVIDSLGTSLDVSVNTVVVAGGEGV